MTATGTVFLAVFTCRTFGLGIQTSYRGELRSENLYGYIEDINIDGYDEAVISNKSLRRILSERRRYPTDLLQTFLGECSGHVATQIEGYHEKLRTHSPELPMAQTIHDMVLAKEEGLDKYLHYDWHRRGSFIDHVMAEDVTLRVSISEYCELEIS
jgi:alpha-amylase